MTWYGNDGIIKYIQSHLTGTRAGGYTTKRSCTMETVAEVIAILYQNWVEIIKIGFASFLVFYVPYEVFRYTTRSNSTKELDERYDRYVNRSSK